MSAVCWECVEDETLKARVKKQGTAQECSLCGKRRRSFSAEDLAEVLMPILMVDYCPGDEIPSIGEGDDDHVYYEQEGDDLESVIQEVLGQYLGFEQEIVAALEANDPADIRDGDVPFFDSSQSYVEREFRHSPWYDKWNGVLRSIKFRRRFFNSEAKAFFDELFRGLESWKYREADHELGVVRELPSGFVLFRSRKCDDHKTVQDIRKNPLKGVGPPPPEKASAGRMNAEGVVVLYCALDEQTAIAELRPHIAGRVATIKLKTTRPLRVLDFTAIAKSIKDANVFDEDYAEEVGRRDFLRALGYRVSKPIVPGNEADYVITQTMVEYLAFELEHPVDGIIYNSAQKTDGMAVALFATSVNFESGNRFSAVYAKNSLRFHILRGIEYQVDTVQSYAIDNGDVNDVYPDPEFPDSAVEPEGDADDETEHPF